MHGDFIADNIGSLAACSIGSFLGIAMMVSALDTETIQRQATERIIQGNKMDIYQTSQMTETQEQKAIQRYETGCLVVPEGYSLLSPDVDSYRFEGLRSGSFVCDRSGGTGKVNPDGSVGDILRTTNESVITRRLTRL